jgi:hypothetical protein
VLPILSVVLFQTGMLRGYPYVTDTLTMLPGALHAGQDDQVVVAGDPLIVGFR